MPLTICVRVFVVSPGAGRSGHSSGHQVCRQHPQGLCDIALHHPVNSYIVLLAAGLRPHWVEETVTYSLSVSLSFCFLKVTICRAAWRCCPLSSTACSSWGPFWSSRPLSSTATRAGHPPTPAGRRTLGGPRLQQQQEVLLKRGGKRLGGGVERRTESWRKRRGKVFDICKRRWAGREEKD